MWVAHKEGCVHMQWRTAASSVHNKHRLVFRQLRQEEDEGGPEPAHTCKRKRSVSHETQQTQQATTQQTVYLERSKEAPIVVFSHPAGTLHVNAWWA